jgi:hypothetical protein
MGTETTGSVGSRVRDVVRCVVCEVAPDELPIVDGLCQFDNATVVRHLTGRGRRREPLGFGVDELAVLATPVVWLAVDEAAKRAAGMAVDTGATRVAALWRRLFRRRPGPATVAPLTREQLAAVHESVLRMARQRGVSERRAADIAAAVVAGLVLADPDQEAG